MLDRNAVLDPDLGSSCVIVSPHLDDAVLSLGGAISSSAGPPRVVTVCAGVPAGDSGPAPWDERAGFGAGAEAARARIAEDLSAAALLGFEPVHLDFPDGPYAADPWPVEDVAEALGAHLDGARAVYVPAGLGGHPDHVRTRDVTLRVALEIGVPEIRLYADLPHVMPSPHWRTDRFHLEPHTVLEPLVGLGADWCLGDPRYRQLPEVHWARKRRAVLAYASQLAPLAQDFPGFMARSGPLLTEAVWTVTAGAGPARGRPAEPAGVRP